MLKVGVLSHYLNVVRYESVGREKLMSGRKKRIVRGVTSSAR